MSNGRTLQWREDLQRLFPDPDLDDLFGFSPLHKAVLGLGDYELERELTSPNMRDNINITDHDGKTPLAWAVRRGDIAAARLLLEYGADCNQQDTIIRWSPLFYAILASLTCVNLLLEAGADIEARTKAFHTPLHQAAGVYLNDDLKGLEIVQCLLKKGCRIDARNFFGRTALHIAADRGNEAIANYLIAKGADISSLDARGRNAFIEAVRNNLHTTIGLLLRYGPDFTGLIESKGFVHLAAEFADARSLQILAHGNLKRRDINQKDRSGLTPIQIGLRRTDTGTEWKEAFVDFLKSIDKDEPHGDFQGPALSREMRASRVAGIQLGKRRSDEDGSSSDGEFMDAVEFHTS